MTMPPRYPARCPACRRPSPPARRHLASRPTPRDVPGVLLDAAPVDPGAAGARARREYERRHNAREDDARQTLGKLDVFLARAIDEPARASELGKAGPPGRTVPVPGRRRARPSSGLGSSRRGSRRKRTAELKSGAGGAKAKASKWWTGVQDDWTKHIDKIRKDVHSRKEEHDLKRAEHHAEPREDDAVAAAAFAYAAFEEAEYALLDAILAREEADQLAAAR
jgi:hypothetical protein